jgi:ubiquinone biosynthesis protein UbiJ
MFILTLGQYAAAITAILVLVGIIVKWGIVKPIKTYIDQATAPIQPTANGGRSLPDVIAGIKRIETKMEFLEERLTKLEGKKSRKS